MRVLLSWNYGGLHAVVTRFIGLIRKELQIETRRRMLGGDLTNKWRRDILVEVLVVYLRLY